ncbi:hypothetical protein [Thalassolituus marinus]|uniref:Uncharacterized protein n=1 Tax=Thalassolituus marinus TaxID=671053 RepID=A0ABS7ZU20_9GAMM|nr:hypothetical protein [Thalassolituus marinus]MCA6063905.1 hypothetical protein [Thalassolituus marinus]
MKELLASIKSVVAGLREGLSNATYQPGRAIRKFPINTKLESIGPIFFSKPVIGRLQTNVSIRFSGQLKTHVPYELIPMLVIGNTYEGKETFPPQKFDKLKTKIHKRTGEYQDDEGTWWLTFQDSNQKTIRIRQLELARALFLHNPHLIRAAFRPNGLGSIAHARHLDDYFSEIQFHTLADYPASNLRSQSVLDHLIWLYFDEEGKRSFHSIYRCLQNGSSEIWNFQFIPPNLNGWQLEVYGRWGDEQDFVADSIKAVGHPGFNFWFIALYRETLLLSSERSIRCPGSHRPSA